jgi:hypothetical protein
VAYCIASRLIERCSSSADPQFDFAAKSFTKRQQGCLSPTQPAYRARETDNVDAMGIDCSQDIRHWSLRAKRKTVCALHREEGVRHQQS